jgi:hypothetical protein
VIRKKFVRLIKEKYNIRGSDKKILSDSTYTNLINDLDSVLQISNSDGSAMTPIFHDSNKLKVSSCQVVSIDPTGFLSHNCFITHGNSGGAIWKDSNSLIGIASGGEDTFGFGVRKNWGVNSGQFYNIVHSE